MSTESNAGIQYLCQSENDLFDRGYDSAKVTDAQRKVLDERMVAYKISPNEGVRPGKKLETK